MENKKEFKRGDIWVVEIPFIGGSIQYGERPIILCSNDIANLHSTVLHAIPLTTKKKPYLPTHTVVNSNSGLYRNSTALAEQVMPISKDMFIEHIGYCDEAVMKRVDVCLGIHLGLIKLEKRNNYVSA